jgi:hypothetical protein
MARALRTLLLDNRGSIAPTVAISLAGLLVAGGVAFDYARMASLDTELQNAADQAALAAASQLDGQTGACARAAAAAAGMVANTTLMANEAGSTRSIVVAEEPGCDASGKIRFWQNIGKTTAATSDANARFIEVTVNSRTAHYALTPIVAAMNSGAMAATAFASLGQAYCKTPPVMICNPQETSTSTGFDLALLTGKGLELVSVGQNGSWAPGNFGYLSTGGGSSGAPGLREALGWGTPPGDCIEASGVDTKPGATVTVTDALNTRFDIYQDVACPSGGACPASINSVKDVRRPANANGNNACREHSQGWSLPSGYYGDTLPTSVAALLTSQTPTSMGHPRDICHAAPDSVAGACTGPMGDGNWDRDAYFRTNYRRADGTYWTGGTGAGSWRQNTGLSATAKRYDVYVWEINNRGLVIDGVTVLGAKPAGATGNTPVSHGQAVCSPVEGHGAAVVPGGASPDRRKITVAIVNCLEQGVNGSSNNVQVKEWIDVFLVEPSMGRSRTSAGDVYVEVVGRAGNSTTTSVQQVKKAVPYLIE